MVMATGDRYRAEHARSLKDPDGFWAEQAAKLDWSKRWGKVLDDSRAPFYAWFTGGELNACYNALDRHADGARADQAALIYNSPVTDSKKTFTYRELRDRVARARRRDRRARRQEGRPGDRLHADDSRGGDGDAGLRAARRHPFGGVRRLRGQRARHPHRRQPAQAGADRLVRHRARPHRPLQAAARPGDRDSVVQGAEGHPVPAAAVGRRR